MATKFPGVKESNWDRLSKLALPNCHLVEAVLKQHYHVFNDDCRDRLKRLLEVILTVNGGKGKFDKLEENLKRRCIKNLKLRLQSLETAHRKKEEMNKGQFYTSELGNPCGDHIIKNDDSKEMQVLFKASCDKRRCSGSPPREIVECGDHSENEKEQFSYRTISDLKSSHDKFLSEFISMQEKPSSVAVCERHSIISEYCPPSLDLEAQMQDIDKLFAEYKINLTDALDGSTLILHERNSKVIRRKKRSPERYHRRKRCEKEEEPRRNDGNKEEYKKYCKDVNLGILVGDDGKDKGTGDGVSVEKKKKKKKRVAFKDPPIVLSKSLDSDGMSLSKLGELPALAVRCYVTFLADMERNSGLYENFIKQAIKPTDTYKQPYIKAAYNCWMEYFNYNMHTLDYLHPYIKDLVRTCREYRSGHPMVRQYETKLPVVLVNTVKNIRPWRRALEETIECCKHLTREEKKDTVSLNVHQLYVRYHKKIEALNSATSIPMVK